MKYNSKTGPDYISLEQKDQTNYNRRMKVLLLKNKTSQLDKYEIAFKDHGFEPLFLPLIKHTHVPEEVMNLLQVESYLNNLEYIIVTSQRTVECLSESVLPRLPPSTREVLLRKTVYAVGPATRDFLLRIGFCTVRGGEDAGTGSILADLIYSDIIEEDGRLDHHHEILLLVGEIRRDIIPVKLAKKGLDVKEVITYKTVNLEDNADRFQEAVSPNSWMVLFSPQGTVDILEFWKKRLTEDVKIASIGPTTESFLNESGIQPHVISAKPDADNLLNAICEYDSRVDRSNVRD